MSTEIFPYDVFLSHSAKDKAVVRASSLSASNGGRAGMTCRSRLRQDGLTPDAKGRRLKDEVELQPSAFSLEPLLRAPLNQQRQFRSGPHPSSFFLRLAPPSKAPWRNSLTSTGARRTTGSKTQLKEESKPELPTLQAQTERATSMAETTILNPNDQPTGRWRLINGLRECLTSEDYDTLLMAVAFAKTGPLLRLNVEIDQWRSKGKKIEAIFGVNHKNTSRQALELALEKITRAETSKTQDNALPTQVDSETRLDTTTSGPGKRLTYFFTLVNLALADIDHAQFTQTMRQQLAHNYRSNSDMAGLRSLQVELHYVYRDKHGNTVATIILSPRDL